MLVQSYIVLQVLALIHFECLKNELVHVTAAYVECTVDNPDSVDDEPEIVHPFPYSKLV